MLPSGSSTIASPKGRGFKSHSHQHIFCLPRGGHHLLAPSSMLLSLSRPGCWPVPASQPSKPIKCLETCSVIKTWNNIDLEPFMVGMCAAERQQNNTYPKWKQVGNVCLVLLGFVGMGAAEALWRSLLTTPHARLGATAREHWLCALAPRLLESLRLSQCAV